MPAGTLEVRHPVPPIAGGGNDQYGPERVPAGIGQELGHETVQQARFRAFHVNQEEPVFDVFNLRNTLKDSGPLSHIIDGFKCQAPMLPIILEQGQIGTETVMEDVNRPSRPRGTYCAIILGDTDRHQKPESRALANVALQGQFRFHQ